MEPNGAENAGIFERNVMLNLTSQELSNFAAQTGFLQNALEKAMRIVSTLYEISEHPFLRDSFRLKGGTALNLFVYDMPRLSVDIDVNYVRELDKHKMENERKQIARIIPSILSATYDVSQTRDEHALLQFELGYQTATGSNDMLKIEINCLHRLPMIPTANLSFERFGQSVEFPVLGLEELLAAKVVTLLSRYTPRDLYDIYQTTILEPQLDQGRFRSLILYYALMSRRQVSDLFTPRWENITESDIRRLLHPLLIRGKYPSRDELTDKASAFLKSRLSLTDSENVALRLFYATGNLPYDALFPQQDLVERIKKSPALAWKIQNVKEYVTQQ